MDLYKSATGPKIIGIGEAVVLEVRVSPNDPAHEVKISHPDLGPTEWVPYVAHAGFYRVPRIGDVCYVFCNENFHQYPVAWGHRISEKLATQLIGGRADNVMVIYSSGESNSAVTHKIELDDGSDKGIRITSAAGHIISLADSGAVTVRHKDGASAVLTGDSVTLSAGGSTLVLDASGMKVTSSGGSSLEVGASIIGVAADMKSKFDDVGVATHNHTGNLGYPTTPPTKGT
jgi:hypothetical protein